jgi:hypothetical protein
MGRYERNVYFERLVTLRLAYGTKPDDTRSVLLIPDAIAYVDAVMTAWDLEDELEMAIVSEPAGGADTESSGQTATAVPAPTAGVGDDVKRAERMARLARFFDPTSRKPADRA